VHDKVDAAPFLFDAIEDPIDAREIEDVAFFNDL
jgi:hypothetical protein